MSAGKRMARVRCIIEYDLPITLFHGEGDAARDAFLFHRNDGTWCADNLLPYGVEEIEPEVAGELRRCACGDGCMCNATRFEFVKWLDE